jgi:hypothetical protein
MDDDSADEGDDSGSEGVGRSGAGFTVWTENPARMAAAMEGDVRITPESPGYSTHVVAVATGSGVQSPRAGYVLAFPAPGEFRVKLAYGSGENRASSNIVVVTVEMPSGRDREVLEEYIRPHPILMSASAVSLEAILGPLLEDHADSAYMARPFVILMGRRLRRAISEAPDGFPVEGDVPRLLAELVSHDLGDSPFDEDRNAGADGSASAGNGGVASPHREISEWGRRRVWPLATGDLERSGSGSSRSIGAV